MGKKQLNNHQRKSLGPGLLLPDMLVPCYALLILFSVLIGHVALRRAVRFLMRFQQVSSYFQQITDTKLLQHCKCF